MRKRFRGNGGPTITTSHLVASVLADARQQLADDLDQRFAEGVARCESPVEELFLAAFLHPRVGWEHDTEVEFLYPPSGLIVHANPPPARGLWGWQQISIGGYRVDFIIASTLYGTERRAIVEIDGHDFHERTREQASRDKARDRHLAGLGFQVLRFTGSEVYRDAAAVVDEVIDILTRF